MGAQPQSGPNLGMVMGPDFPAVIGNLARNVRENRLGVLSAVLTRDRTYATPLSLGSV
jgi:hypothetical protein